MTKIELLLLISVVLNAFALTFAALLHLTNNRWKEVHLAWLVSLQREVRVLQHRLDQRGL